MPLYQYRCDQCRKEFEKIQAFGEEPLTVCPELGCGGILVRVIFDSKSPPGFHFKGGRPSAARSHRVGKRDIPVHQTEDGHFEQSGIMDKR